MSTEVLFINGVPDNSFLYLLKKTLASESFLSSGSCNLYKYLKEMPPNRAPLRMKILMLDASPNLNLDYFEKYQILFNQIAEADTHQITLKNLIDLKSQRELIWFNDPEFVLQTRRDQVYSKLKHIEGLTMPKTVRTRLFGYKDIFLKMKTDKLQFPLIVRECGLHSGRSTVLLKHNKDLDALHSLALDGRYFYLIQYHDYREQGVYTKYRLAIVDGVIYLRGIGSGKDWNVHYQNHIALMKQDAYYKEYEKQLILDFQQRLKALIQPAIKQVYQALKLDYFGMDCHISNQGELLVFEANASMNILQEDDTPEMCATWDKANEDIKDAIVAMILSSVK